MRALAKILPLKSQFSGKIQRFNAIDGSNKRDPIRKPPQGNFSVSPQPTLHQINLTTSLEQECSYVYIQKYTDICFQSVSIM